MNWQKENEAQYKHLLGFFKERPQMLVNCGIYTEEMDGLRFFFNANGEIQERFATWEERGRHSSKKYMTKAATEAQEGANNG